MAITTEAVGSQNSTHLSDAILLQGPFYPSKTAKYIVHYLGNNPETIVILSTYKDEHSLQFVNQYKNDRLYIIFVHIENDDTILKNNYANKNFQRITTYHGLLVSRQLKIKHTLKSRTDSVFAKPKIIDFFKEQLTKYEKPFETYDHTRSRIIIPPVGTLINNTYGPFHIADHWLFGTTDDLLEYFTLDPLVWNKGEYYRSNITKIFHSPESEAGSLWVHKSKLNVKNTRELVGRYFIVLNNEDCNFIFKYNDLDEDYTKHLVAYNDAHNGPPLITSKIWFNTYNKILNSIKMYERSLFLCADQTIANKLIAENIKNVVYNKQENDDKFNSFVNMLQQFIDSQYDYVIFCESNLTIKKYIKDDICKILYFMEKYDYDLILLGYLLVKFEQLDHRWHFIKKYRDIDFYSYDNNLWGSHMFIHTRKSAIKLLDFISKNNESKQIPNSVDWIFTKFGKRALVYPPLAISNNKNDAYYIECYNSNIKYFEQSL